MKTVFRSEFQREECDGLRYTMTLIGEETEEGKIEFSYYAVGVGHDKHSAYTGISAEDFAGFYLNAFSRFLPADEIEQVKKYIDPSQD